MTPELTTTETTVAETKKTRKAAAKKNGKAKKATAKKAPAAKRENGVTPNMVKVLGVLKSGKEYTARELADKTGIVKGKRLPQLVEMGLAKELVPEEGERGKRFVITAAGRKALTK